MNKIIEVESLTKEYRRIIRSDKSLAEKIRFRKEYEVKKAIDNVSFNIEEGEMVGYLGLNGAGKSTTVKILAGILAPTSGKVNVLGIDPFLKRKECSKQTSTLFGQKSQLWWDLPVWDSIQLAKYLYSMSAADFWDNYNYIDKYLDISEIKNIPVRQLSLGQRMKANLCFSLLHNPKILFLDEPTIGLDILTKQQVHDCIKKMNHEKGTTMILTTHDVSDIESLCERVILIDKGRIVFDNSLEHLKKGFISDYGIVISFDECDRSDRIIKLLNEKEITYEKSAYNEFLVNIPHNVFFQSEIFTLLNERFSISSITPVNDSLNLVLTKVYESLGKKDKNE